MRVPRKLLSINFKRYIIPIFIVVVIFFATDYVLVKTIRNYYMAILETQLTSFGRIYSHSLAKGNEAYHLINGLLEEKLLGVGKTAASQTEALRDTNLTQLAEMLSVDEILIYNLDGVVEYATDPRYIGWQTYPGHASYTFMVGDDETFVEDVRQNSVTLEYYKYGYVRADNGYVVQVGVQADTVQGVLGPFDIQQLLSEITSLELVNHICFVDDNFVITASSEADAVGLRIEHKDGQAAAAHDELRSVVGIGHHELDDSLYEVYVPIYAGGERAGTMVISKPLHDSKGMGQTISILSVIASGAVMVGFLYVMVTNYQHNKDLVALAYHEPLTGLPNKAYLEHVLETHFKNPPEGRHAVLMTHCLNVRIIHSVYGFDAGDRVTQELARRLEHFAQDKCMAFHFATNRFVLFVQDFKEETTLTNLVERLHETLERPFDALGVTTRIAAKTGIVELGANGDDVGKVFTKALVALQFAEESDVQNYAFSDWQMAAKLRRQESIASEMRDFLLDNNQSTMYLVYQPKVELESNRIVGFEALARMNSPSLGIVPPDEFIKIAERQDLIIPLGYWVLETACQFVQEMITTGHPDPHVAVNVSGIQLLHDGFISQVQDILERSGIKGHFLELEITESVLIEGFSHVRKTLTELRDMGIKIAIDDFGTGYSSLARMEILPVDIIKIDKYFVDRILIGESRQSILRHLISMVHNLGLKVVAEGVEHELQRRLLQEWGCDLMQGYLFSKPLPAHEALAKLQDNSGTKSGN